MLRNYSISAAQFLARGLDMEIIAATVQEAETIALQRIKDGLVRWSHSEIHETNIDGHQDKGPISFDAAKAHAQRLANATQYSHSVFALPIAPDDDAAGFHVQRAGHGDQLNTSLRATVQPHGISKAQQRALLAVYRRGEANPAPSYRAFRRRAQRPSYDVCVMVPWAGMWLGIEPDGYTHS